MSILLFAQFAKWNNDLRQLLDLLRRGNNLYVANTQAISPIQQPTSLEEANLQALFGNAEKAVEDIFLLPAILKLHSQARNRIARSLVSHF
jgi:hypothetical protein